MTPPSSIPNTYNNNRRGFLLVSIILSIIIIDQVLKIWVKTHFFLGETITIFPWFKLAFIQNNGMAFGWEIGSKLLLTLSRIALVVFLIYYICKVQRYTAVRTGYLICIALIIAGAIGNIIDCVFYGKIFSDPMPPAMATLFPHDGGYGQWMQGRVVDMLYFPLCHWIWPEWMPFVGGEQFLFFRPVFNIADAAISIGIIVLICFYSKQIKSIRTIREDS